MAGFLKRIQLLLVLKGMKVEADVGATVKRGLMQDASILPFAVIIVRSQTMQSQDNVLSFSRNANANTAMNHSESICIIV
ncbi:unnamed protein product [Sphenostylis stenocarpa]|uniref:Uncharacterized protein n=1 Tax=Sphenostylis stenocarpa TaxID=92480 RepID=A0AA86VPT1_9FABA|nr:unnamed protein product [Sphenostylis stenocarpa]